MRLAPAWDGGDVPLDPDGFVHLSAPAQAIGTANRHYAEAASLLLLAVDETVLDPDLLRWERSTAAPFPHLYAPLPRHAVLGAVAFPRSGDGWHDLPAALADLRPARPPALRDATAADVPDLAALHWRTVGVAYEGLFPPDAPFPTIEALREHADAVVADPAVAVIVAERGGRVAGFVHAGPDPDDPSIGRLARLHVGPEAWGEGLGRLLRDAATARLADAGFTIAALWVLEHNAQARALYEEAGWRLDPTRTITWPEGGPMEVRYERELGAATRSAPS